MDGGLGFGSLEILDAEEHLRQLEAACASLEAALGESEVAAAESFAVLDVAERRVQGVYEKIGSIRQEAREVREKVAVLTKTQLNEVKALRTNPPRVVRQALEALWIILNCKLWVKGSTSMQTLDISKEWSKVQRLLTGDNFVKTVSEFNCSELNSVPWVVDYVASQYFSDVALLCGGSLPLAQGIVTTATGDISAIVSPMSGTRSESLGSSAKGVAMLKASPSERRTNRAGSLTAPPPRGGSSTSSLKTAGLAAVKGNRPTQAVALDIDTVERASQACGVLVRWCIQVVREFGLLQALHCERLDAVAGAAAAAPEAAARREAAAACAERLRTALSERDSMRRRLAQLKLAEIDAEKAMRQLAKLQRLQDQMAEEAGGTCDAAARRAARAKAAEPPAPAPKSKPPPLAPKAVKATPPPTPVEEAKTPVDDSWIVIDASPPTALPNAFRDPKSKFERAEYWWVPCDYNEVDLCKRGALNYREQQKRCDSLAKYLQANPHVVVFIEGGSSGSDEDPGIAQRRAEALAVWLRLNGVHVTQLRTHLPQHMSVAMEEDAAVETCKKASRGIDGVGGEEDDVEADEEGDSEADEEEDEDSAMRIAPRCIRARPLREVRVLEGPRSGDAAQQEQPGLFFAPEDHELDALGDASSRILLRMANALQRVFAEEGRRPVLLEGHADEGIEDDGLLHRLARKRAEDARNFLLWHVGQRCADDDRALPEDLTPAAPVRHGSKYLAAKKCSTELAADALSADSTPPVLLKKEEVIAISRSKAYRVTETWGRCGLNRRVQLFIL